MNRRSMAFLIGRPISQSKSRSVRRCRGGRALTSIGFLLLGLTLLGLGCAGPLPEAADHAPRVERATRGIEEDPLIAARRAGVAAAQAREETTSEIDEFEIRLRHVYGEPNSDVRVMARVPVKRPGEIRAQRQILRAETEVAVSKLEEASLERHAELCFPSVVALAYAERMRIYTRYADQQKLLFDWNEQWRSSGLINELNAAGFELESKTQLAIRKPAPIRVPDQVLGELPSIGHAEGSLIRDGNVLRETVSRHHPSIAVRRASADRYRALANQAQARRLPWLRFVDLSYERGSKGTGENEFGGQLAFTVPVGSSQSGAASRYRHLASQESSEATARLNDRFERTSDALLEIQSFEFGKEHLRELADLATRAEMIADRWRQSRLAKPSAVAALLDRALSARTAIVDARERAAVASCTLLAMSGVPIEEWPRDSNPAGDTNNTNNANNTTINNAGNVNILVRPSPQ